jgi:hypothetical protein
MPNQTDIQYDERIDQPIVRYIDTNTGIYRDVYEGDYFKHIPKGSAEAIASKAFQKLNSEVNMDLSGLGKFNAGMFMKVFTDEFAAVMKEMQPNEIALMFILSEYMEVGSNVLVKKNNKSKVRMKDVIRYSKMSQATAYKAVKGLLDKLLIIKCTDIDGQEQFVVNPYIMIKGGWLNKTIKRLFEGYQRRALQK